VQYKLFWCAGKKHLSAQYKLLPQVLPPYEQVLLPYERVLLPYEQVLMPYGSFFAALC